MADVVSSIMEALSALVSEKRISPTKVDHLYSLLENALLHNYSLPTEFLASASPLSKRVSNSLPQSKLSSILAIISALCPAKYSIDWIFSQLNTQGNQKIYLATLDQYILLGHFNPVKHIPLVLSKMTHFLSNNVHIQQLPDALSVVTTIANHFPASFSLHFKELIDLLLGWRLHPGLPVDVGRAICDCFVALPTFWKGHQHFVTELLRSFITQIKDCSAKIQALSYDESTLVTLGSILACFVSIIEAAGPTMVKSTSLTVLFVSFYTIFQTLRDASIADCMNDGLVRIFAVLESEAAPYYGLAVDYILAQLGSCTFWKRTKMLLELNLSLIYSQKSAIQIPAVGKLLTVESVISNLRLHWDKRVTDVVLQTYQSLIESSTIVGRTITSLILDELAQFHIVLKGNATNINPEIADKDAEAKHKLLRCFTCKQIEILFSFDVLLLSSPSISKLERTSKIFGELLEQYHPISDVISQHKLIQLSLLVAIQYIHRNNAIIQQISQISSKIQWIIRQLLETDTNSKILLFCCDWIASLTSFPVFAQEFLSEIVLSLVTPAFHSNHIVRLSVSILLHKLLEEHYDQIKPSIRSTLIPSIQLLLSDNDSEISSNYFKILSFLGTDNIAHYNNEIISMQSAIVSIPACTSFKAHYFKTVMSYLQQPAQSISFSFLTRASDLCQVVQEVEKKTKQRQQARSLCRQAFQSNFKLKWFWIILECANLITRAHLRSHFGNPMQTFGAIEKMLQDVAQGDSGYHGNVNASTLVEYSPHALQCLLQFINDLEKRIYVAMEGALCLSALPSGNLFFLSNRKVCVGWYSRMRQPAVICSVINATANDIIYQTLRRLTEIANECRQSPKDPSRLQLDAEYAMIHLCKALATIHESDALSGVITHFSTLFSASELSVRLTLPWNKAIQYQSAFQYEYALEEYKTALHADIAVTTKQFIIEQIVDCYVRLGDWSGLQTWQNEYNSSLPSNRYSLQFIEALSALDEGDYDTTREKLKDFPLRPDALSDDQRALQLDAALLRMMANKATGNAMTNEQRIIQDIAHSKLQRVMNVHETLPLEMMLYSAACLQGRVKAVRNISINEHRHDAGMTNLLLRTEKVTCSDSLVSQSKLLLPSIKLARKQGNFNLAQRLISKANTSLSESLPIEFEKCRLLRKQKSPYDALQHASNIIEQYTLTTSPQGPSNIICSIFLKLANWVHKDRSLLTSQAMETKVTTLMTTSTFNSLLRNHVNPDETLNEKLNGLQGDFLRNAMSSDNTSSKAHVTYAHWCYVQGNTAEQSHSYWNSTQQKIALILGESRMNESTKALFQILHEDFGTPAASVHQKLCEQAIPLSEEQTNALMKLRKHMETETLHFFSQAVLNYFRFLSVGSVEHYHEDHNIIATLRLLKLLVKYGTSMQDLFTTQLETTPTEAWRGITPQLFSRLGHPDSWIQCQVQQLISRIGMEHPHDIVYPVLVGEVDIQNDLAQQQQFHAISSILRKQFAQLYEEVHSLLHEFTRLTVLWPEIGCTLLQRITHEIRGRIQTVQEEYQRIQSSSIPHSEKDLLMKEKYGTIMKLFHIQLSNFLDTISKEPETPFESWFQKSFLSRLQSATAEFIHPSTFQNPEALWKPFERFNEEFSRIFKSGALPLKEMSPKLAKMNSSIICMPGLQGTMKHTSEDDMVTIQSFVPSFVVLPTKTKPKKLIMIGSDGLEYPYLLKGREDLHLDERIMQFLDVTNQIFKRVKQTSTRHLTARTFAVIPIGRRSGLIQWVNGSTPIFQVHKQWQRRTESNQPKKDATMQRTVDRYNEKLRNALQSVGITDFSISARKTWPLDVLRHVFLEMRRETPSDLLEKEFWCSSGSMEQWWDKTQSFTRSVAVMSIIGYILGLGDRHLDNILVDFASGEVVHIDYNICFERGLKLRIPELVPFRLTSIIERAFGVTGMEGTFRIACAHVLKVLREHKETLLTLLQAFVYDPLVDWTLDKEETQNRLQMELNTNLSLLSSRAAGVYDTLKEQASVGDDICVLYSTRGGELVDAQWERYQLLQKENELQERIAMLTKELNDPTRNERSVAYKQAISDMQNYRERILNFQKQIHCKIEEMKAKQDTFNQTYYNICHNEFIQDIATYDGNALLEHFATLDHLEDLAIERADIVGPYAQADEKIRELITQRSITISHCMDELIKYKELVRPLFYCSYTEQNIFALWIPLLQGLYNTLNDIPSIIHFDSSQYVADIPAAVRHYEAEYLQIRQERNDMKQEIDSLEKNSVVDYKEEQKQLLCSVCDYCRSRNVSGPILQAAVLPFLAMYSQCEIPQASHDIKQTIFDVTSFSSLYSAFGMSKDLITILMENWKVSSTGTQPPPWALSWMNTTQSLIHSTSRIYRSIVSSLLPSLYGTFLDTKTFLEFESKIQQLHKQTHSSLEQLKSINIQKNTFENDIQAACHEKDSCLQELKRYEATKESHTWEDHDEIDRLQERTSELQKLIKESSAKLRQLQTTEKRISTQLSEYKKTYSTICSTKRFENSKETEKWILILQEFRQLEGKYCEMDLVVSECSGGSSSELILCNIFLVEVLACASKLLQCRQNLNLCDMMQQMNQIILGYYEMFYRQLVVPSFEYVVQMIVGGYGQMYHISEDYTAPTVRSVVCQLFADNEHFSELFAQMETFSHANSEWMERDIRQQRNEIRKEHLQQCCSKQADYLTSYGVLHDSFLKQNIHEFPQDDSVSLLVFTIRSLLSELQRIDDELMEQHALYLPLEDEFDELISWERRDSGFHTITHERITTRRDLFEKQRKMVQELREFVSHVVALELHRDITSNITCDIQQELNDLVVAVSETISKYTSTRSKISELDELFHAEKSSHTQRREDLAPLEKQLQQIRSQSKQKQLFIVNKAKSMYELASNLQKKFAEYINQFTGLVPLVKSILKQMENISDEAIHVVAKNLHVKYRRLCSIAESVVQPMFGVLKVTDIGKLQEQIDFNNIEKMVNGAALKSLEELTVLMKELCKQVIEVSEAASQQITLWKEKEQIATENDKDFEHPLLQATSESFTKVNEYQNREQVRNVYAISALKRIKAKLQGSDFGSTKTSVSEQVDNVIRSATNIDHLASLYEGWTAWI